MKEAHPDENIGVFFCGPGGLSSGIRETVRNLNRRTMTTRGGRQGSRSGDGEATSSPADSAARPSNRRGGSFRGGEISYFEEVFFSSDVGAKVAKKK